MKKKSLNKKLGLIKETIANLDDVQKNKLKGGKTYPCTKAVDDPNLTCHIL